MKKQIDLAGLQHTRYRLSFEKLLIEQNDLERALLFRKYYPLDECLKDFLEENGSEDMKWLFSIPDGSVRVTSEEDAIAACRDERDAFECWRVRVFTPNDSEKGQEHVGWMSTDMSRHFVFVTLAGEIIKESDTCDFLKLWSLVK